MSSSPAKRLLGKVAVVTGSARGIGTAITTLFYQHGWHIVVADLLDDQGLSLAKTIDGSCLCNYSLLKCNEIRQGRRSNQSSAASA